MSDATIWEPVADGEYVLTQGDDKYAIKVSGSGSNVDWEKNGYYHRAQSMEFPQGYALCRQVPAPVGASVPSEIAQTLREALTYWRTGMEFDEERMHVDKALTWLAQRGQG